MASIKMLILYSFSSVFTALPLTYSWSCPSLLLFR